MAVNNPLHSNNKYKIKSAINNSQNNHSNNLNLQSSSSNNSLSSYQNGQSTLKSILTSTSDVQNNLQNKQILSTLSDVQNKLQNEQISSALNVQNSQQNRPISSSLRSSRKRKKPEVTIIKQTEVKSNKQFKILSKQPIVSPKQAQVSHDDTDFKIPIAPKTTMIYVCYNASKGELFFHGKKDRIECIMLFLAAITQHLFSFYCKKHHTNLIGFGNICCDLYGQNDASMLQIFKPTVEKFTDNITPQFANDIIHYLQRMDVISPQEQLSALKVIDENSKSYQQYNKNNLDKLEKEFSEQLTKLSNEFASELDMISDNNYLNNNVKKDSSLSPHQFLCLSNSDNETNLFQTIRGNNDKIFSEEELYRKLNSKNYSLNFLQSQFLKTKGDPIFNECFLININNNVNINENNNGNNNAMIINKNNKEINESNDKEMDEFSILKNLTILVEEHENSNLIESELSQNKRYKI